MNKMFTLNVSVRHQRSCAIAMWRPIGRQGNLEFIF